MMIESHQLILHRLSQKSPGDRFKDTQGEEYTIIRIDDKYPRPGYICTKVGDSQPDRQWFVGFDSIYYRDQQQ